MQIILNEKKTTKSGFTLIEMIGVLAVIGILAALLVPKIFNAINNARVNSTAVSIATIKTATADHYAKFGSLVSSNGNTENVGITTPFANFDTALVTEQLLDKPLSVAITDPTNVSVAVVQIPSAAGGGVTVNSSDSVTNAAAKDWSFDLSDTNATGSTGSTIAGSFGVVVYLANVQEADAKALNDLIDGPALGVPLGIAAQDLYGRVKYSSTSAKANGLVDVTVYITHR